MTFVVKNILIISIITSQLVWNISDSLVRESWMTEEQSEQDFSKENLKKEKEISLGSFFRNEISGPALHEHFYSYAFSLSDHYTSYWNTKYIPFIKIPLYLMQSCIRV